MLEADDKEQKPPQNTFILQWITMTKDPWQQWEQQLLGKASVSKKLKNDAQLQAVSARYQIFLTCNTWIDLMIPISTMFTTLQPNYSFALSNGETTEWCSLHLVPLAENIDQKL